MSARWGDPDGDGQRRLEERAHDVTRGVQRTARRIELDDHGGGAGLGGFADAVIEIAGHDLVDDAGRGQHDDLRLGAARLAGDQQKEAGQGEQERQATDRSGEAVGHA